MIAISIISRAGVAVREPQRASFGEAGGVIGRGEDCTLVLPDADRHISRKQLRVSCRDGRYYVRAISANVEVQIDGKTVPVDVDHPIAAGTRIRVGPYLLQVTRSEPDAKAPPDIDLVVGEATDPHAGLPSVPAPLSEAEQGLVAALYAGLGRLVPANPQPAQLRLVGELLRTAVQGTLALLAVRSIAKRELGADLTMPRVRENNPLKFSPDVDAALAHLLGPPHRGFLAPRTAVASAFDDLRAHEVAMLTGMRAAVDAMLARFDPEALKQRLVPKGGWQQLLPAARKAELWDGYEQTYARIVEEIESDFDSQFAQAFLQAYRQQVAQLAPGLPARNGTTDGKD